MTSILLTSYKDIFTVENWILLVSDIAFESKRYAASILFNSLLAYYFPFSLILIAPIPFYSGLPFILLTFFFSFRFLYFNSFEFIEFMEMFGILTIHAWLVSSTATWRHVIILSICRHDSDIGMSISVHQCLYYKCNFSCVDRTKMNWKFHQPWRALKVLMFDGGDSMQVAWQSNKSLKWFGDHQSLLCKVFMKWNYDDLLPWYDFQLPQALSAFSLTSFATFDIDLFLRL
jgi:hypothetical protein